MSAKPARDLGLHLRTRPPAAGRFWPNTEKVAPGKYSKELWLCDGTVWQKVIDYRPGQPPTIALTEDTDSCFDVEFSESQPLFRVANCDQLLWHPDGYVLSLSPAICTRLRARALARVLTSQWLGDALAFVRRALEEGTDPFCVTAAKGHPTLGQFLAEWRAESGRHYSLRDVVTLCADEILNDIHSTAARHIMNLLPAALHDAVHVYNSYFGSATRPVLNFHGYPLDWNGKYEPIQSDPNILNLYSDVRAFCTETTLANVLNYLLPQPVFRGEDIYRRGVDGRSPLERARQYVILEFSFCEALQGIREFRWCRFHSTYTPCAAYGRFLDRAAVLWSQIFQEVRLRANCFVPERIYSVVVDWGQHCSDAADGYCEVCAWFSKGDLLWKRGDPRPDRRALSLLDLDSPQGPKASDLIGVVM